MPPITPATLIQAVTEICRTQPIATGADVENWCARNNVDIASGGGRTNDLFEDADQTPTTAAALQKFKQGRASNGPVAWCLRNSEQASRQWLRGQPGGWLLLPWDAARARWDWQAGTPV